MKTKDAAKLPSSFLFGGAFAANQAEGGYRQGNRGLSNIDILAMNENRGKALVGEEVCLKRQAENYYPSDVAIDFYHRHSSDIELLGNLGINLFKLSISWSRIYPTGEEDTPNEEGIAFYQTIVKELKAQGITPMVELSHYDIPLTLIQKYGGWDNRKLLDCFCKYVETMARALPDIAYWIPIHEINATMHYPFMVAGLIFQEGDLQEQRKLNAVHHQFVAHAKAVQIIHRYQPNAMVGMMEGNELMIPATSSPQDRLASILAANQKFFFMDVLVRGYYPCYALQAFSRKHLQIPFEPGDEAILKQHTVQFVSFPYYNHFTYCVKKGETGIQFVENPHLNPANSYSDPVSLRSMLNLLYDRYQLPIIIGELAIGRKDILSADKKRDVNKEQPEKYDVQGIGGIEDEERVQFLHDHFQAIAQAIDEDGVDCRGVLLWEIIDTLSVSQGTISNRYGLIYVDRDDKGNGTLQRIPKQSYHWLKRYIATIRGESK